MANPTRSPTLKKRRDWRPTFLKALAAKGNVSQAAHKAGIHRDTAYAARESDKGFVAAWESALETACDAMELEARRRAVEGTLKPIYQGGKLVGKVREHSDTLLIFMLKAHRPEKYRETINQNVRGNVHLVHGLDGMIEKVYGDASGDDGPVGPGGLQTKSEDGA